MFLLHETYYDYVITGVPPNVSSYLHYAKMSLLRATEPNNPLFHNSWKSPPSWTKDEVLQVMSKIGKSEAPILSSFCELPVMNMQAREHKTRSKS